MSDPADVAAVTAHLRASLEADIECTRRELLQLVESGELETNPALAAAALAFAALQAVDTARQRTAQHLLATRLEQLREQAAARTEKASAEPWTDRLPELAARPLNSDTTGAVSA
ncbi:hypothetical protein [Streptomyces sp. URMC 123]|uniref:hypothetical protein n=1 Tax=Streptomyces sp. URMC 123 TaxID=3423403 RepID=UPI003F1999ED